MNTIYSYLYSDLKLWKKYNPSISVNSCDIIDKRSLSTKSKSNNDYIIKNFILTEKYLFYLKNEEIKGYVELTNIGIEFCISEKKISLFNNNKYFSLYFNDIKDLKLWKKHLKRKCIFNNFQNYFDIIGKLGEGGNAQVYLAKKIKNQKEYAIKIISKSNIEEENTLNSLINEINILRKLNNENVTKYHSLYESNNNFYLVMEYCNFKTLKKFIKNKSTSAEKISVVNQILSGLSYIHSMNLVHRDLKPDNIFLHKNKTGELIVKIGDFGLSNFLNEPFIFKKCGTPGFIAPEILNYNKYLDYKITDKVDIYSIGHIIYYIFMNENIFEFDDLNDLITKNQKNRFKLNKKTDKNLKKVVESCLILSPLKRIEISKLKEMFIN